MSLTKWRRPHSITLPGGLRIPVVYWSNKKMRHENRNDPTFGREDLCGYWDTTKIVINSSEPLWIQIKTLGHELVHAVNDYTHWLEQTYVDPIKQEAGQTLLQKVEEGEE